MVRLIPVKYTRLHYPDGIRPEIQEIAAHFDKGSINPYMPFSLHTEFSHSSRSWNSPIISDYPEICRSVFGGIPLLWRSDRWAEEFAAFVIRLCDGRVPTVIEVHPPYLDYCPLEDFPSRYRIFEETILEHYPKVQLLIENRSGTHYQKSHFALSTGRDLLDLSGQLDGLNLRITLDVPQLFTAHRIRPSSMQGEMQSLFESLMPIRGLIYGIHLWGRKGQAHLGDLNDYFHQNAEHKQIFLETLHCFLDDDQARYFVPEVNSSQADCDSIIRDLCGAGFTFVSA